MNRVARLVSRRWIDISPVTHLTELIADPGDRDAERGIAPILRQRQGVGDRRHPGMAHEVPATLANAVFNATGRRVTDLPITVDKLL